MPSWLEDYCECGAELVQNLCPRSGWWPGRCGIARRELHQERIEEARERQRWARRQYRQQVATAANQVAKGRIREARHGASRKVHPGWEVIQTISPSPSEG